LATVKERKMQTEEQNYGVIGEPSVNHPASMSAQEEKSWSVLAHLSLFLNLFTGFLGPVAALVIWLVYKDRSQKVAFHALQSMWYQVAWLVLLGAGWAFTGLLMLVLIGFLLVPVMVLLTLVPFVQAGYAAYRVSRGEDYRYPIVADLIQDR
jgi:uncharacterized Tic20 family protein